MTSQPASDRAQVFVLARAFLARFFENESTAGRTDLRESFFWLIGFLAAPGVCFAFYEQFFWQFAARGPNAATRLHAYVLHDKALYLTLTMVVMGVITIATRNALVVDRRDALTLGVLPVRPLTIVAAKLMALTAYVGVLSLGMHAGAALLFGAFLSGVQDGVTISRGMLAHLVTATAAGMFVFLSIVATECICVAIAGPRRFARAATIVQMLLLVAIVATLFLTPTIASGAAAIAGSAGAAHWLAYAPPIWFLGLYETLSGSAHRMADLAGSAMRAFASGVILVGVFYPIASQRILRNAVTEGGPVARRWRRAVSSSVVRSLADASDIQAALQFLTTTTMRVGRFRLTMSGAVGVGLTLVAPLVLFWMATGLPSRPSVSLLAAPLLLSMAIVAGWRIVTSMPSELNARWVFLAAPLHGLAGRAAVERMAFATGVVIPTVVALPIWIAAWGPMAAVPFVLNTLLAGGILVGAHFWGFAGVPCTRPLAVSDSNLQGRWPFYLFGLLVYAAGLPMIEVWLSGRRSQWLLTAALVVACLIVRGMAARAAHLNILTNDHRGLILLDLAVVPQPRNHARPVARTVMPTRPTTETPHA